MAHGVARTPTGYTYDVLAAVNNMASTEQINVYGVVTEWSAPKQTRNDLLCTVKITDPSLVDTNSGIISTQDVLVFAPDRAQLPQVRKPGDIIRFHRAKINHYSGRTQVVCSLGSKKQYGPPASMCLFDSTPTPGAIFEEEPYQRSSQSYHFDAREKIILGALRAFVQSGSWKTGQDSDKYRRFIREIITDSAESQNAIFADLVGMVLAVESEGPDLKIVWMWDGTDSPPFPSAACTNVNQGQQQQQQQGEEDADARAAIVLHPRAFPPSSLTPSVAAELPMIGTAVPILIQGNVVDPPAPGSWAKFRNCGFQITQGQLQGVFATKSKWIPWHEDDPVLLKYQNRVAQKRISEWYNPGESICASTVSRINEEVVSLRQVVADGMQPDAPPNHYRSIVRVLSHHPSSIDMMCLPARAVWDASQDEGYTEGSQWLFVARLYVIDGSGTELEVDVFGKDGDEFFQEILPPQDLRTNPTEKNTLTAVMEYLTGNLQGPNPSSQPVWLDMCFRSYIPEDVPGEEREKQQENGNGSTGGARAWRYRICDTKLLRFPPS